MTQSITNEQVMQLALGRIFRLASRPTQEGDVVEHERCRAIFMAAAKREGFSTDVLSIGIHKPGWNFGNMVLE